MNTNSAGPPLGKPRVLLLFLCLFLLLSSGRMDSGDANAQLAGSTNLVETGSLGTSTPYSDQYIQALFVHAPNGRYYEAHDIGNSLLLAPAALGGSVSSAWVSRHLGSAGSDSRAHTATLVAKTLAALTETALSALACFYLFLLFGLFYKARPALILTALFAFATFYTAYFRSAWDVLPACNAVIILLYYSAKLILAPKVRARESFPVALWFGIACMFRFSLAPFLGLSLAIILWDIRKKIGLAAIVAAISVAIAMFVPTLIFNAIRTGSPLRAANTLPQFQDQTGFSGSMATGMFGLLLSPNRGLFVFSPILLLLVLLPWYWRSLPSVVKTLLQAYLPSVLFYYLTIAGLRNWAAAGWGPRYMMPVLPILFLGAGAIAYQLWYGSRVRRALLVSLCSIALLLSIPTLLVDHRNAVLQYPDPFSGTTPYPIQHIAVWKNLLAGLHGQPLQTMTTVRTEEESRLLMVFPDLLVMRVHQVLADHSKAAAGIFLLLYTGALGYTVFLLWSFAGSRESFIDNEDGLPRPEPLQESQVPVT